MADESRENQGPGEAHRRAEKIGADKAAIEAAMGELVAGAAGEAAADQSALMLDEMDEQLALFAGPVAHVADTLAQARGRGRPKGSTNKNAFRDVLMRMGFRHPGLNLAAIANARPEVLARELLCERTEAMGYILKANAELMPYFESKRPHEIEVTERRLGVMLVGEMKSEAGQATAAIDLTNVDPDDE